MVFHTAMYWAQESRIYAMYGINVNSHDSFIMVMILQHCSYLGWFLDFSNGLNSALFKNLFGIKISEKPQQTI